MKKYTTTKSVSFGPGQKLELTPGQASSRAHAIGPFKIEKDQKAVVVTTVAVVQFKAGETIGLPEDPPKGMADSFEAKKATETK